MTPKPRSNFANMSNETIHDEVSCLNCGTSLLGDFCHECGQKQMDLKHKSLRYVVGQFLNAMYFVDGKFFKTFKDFLIVPGALSRAFIEGKRSRYIPPISLFLFINLLFFLFSTANDFNLPLIDQVTLQPYSELALAMAKASASEMGITLKEYESIYNLKSSNLSKTIIILNLPVMALLLQLFNIRRRAYYFIDHFIFATHTLSFILFLFTFFFTPGSFLNEWLSTYVADDNQNIITQVWLIMMTVIYVVYSFLSFRRAYQTSWPEGILASAYMMGIFYFINFWQRMVLFFVVWLSIG